MRRRVWFHRSRAITWALVGVLSFVFGWQNSVVLVWLASVYANVISDWTAGEAADDRKLIDRLAHIEAQLDALLAQKARRR